MGAGDVFASAFAAFCGSVVPATVLEPKVFVPVYGEAFCVYRCRFGVGVDHSLEVCTLVGDGVSVFEEMVQGAAVGGEVGVQDLVGG